MANKFIIDTLITFFKYEIKNKITYTDNEIIEITKDKTRVKISTKNVA